MQKFKKTFVALVMILVMAMPTVAFAQPAQDEPELIPVRAFFEEIGGTVEWQSEDTSIHIAIDGGAVVLFVGQAMAVVNEVLVTLQSEVSVLEGRAFVTEGDLMLMLGVFIETMSTSMVFELTEEARDIALYDFDYMMNAILQNSPWESVLNRTALAPFGFDFITYAGMFRSFIENMEPVEIRVLDENIFRAQFPIQEGDDARSIAANYLFALLNYEFAPHLGGIGHLGLRTLDIYTALLTAFLIQYNDDALSSENNLHLQRLIETYTSPSAVWFYGEIELDPDAEIHDGFPSIQGNVVTEVLVPYVVAYLRINSFLSNPSYDDLVILPFLQEIQDFGHLIIDLRGNTGGLTTYFNELILRRLINEPIEISTREFFAGGELAVNFMGVALQTALNTTSALEWHSILYTEIVTIENFLAENEMPLFDTNDLDRLDYVFLSRVMITPAYESINFEGMVWLLIDDMSMSASVLVAETALYTGFATLVGENTSGVMGSTHIYIALPNTGIIWRIDIGYRTDAMGRSLEVYGVEPQIRNFEDMDAVETILTIIAF